MHADDTLLAEAFVILLDQVVVRPGLVLLREGRVVLDDRRRDVLRPERLKRLVGGHGGEGGLHLLLEFSPV